MARERRFEEALHAVNNAATLRNNYTEAWINGGLILSAMGRSEKSREAFSIAKMMGYNETARDYMLQPEPLLMMETKKNRQDFGQGWLCLHYSLQSVLFQGKNKIRPAPAITGNVGPGSCSERSHKKMQNIN